MEIRSTKYMGECFSDKFILNNEFMNCKEFDNNLISEGKSLYEVIRIIDGVPLFLEDHLERLFNSAVVTGLNIWLHKDKIEHSIRELSEVNSLKDGNIKIIFNFNEKRENTFLAYFIAHNYPNEEMYLNGVKTVLYHAERENPNAKVINMSLREITNKIIKEKNIYEVILVDSNGHITEGSRSNIFMIKENKVYTSPSEDVLIGITRKYIFEACHNLGYEVLEEKTKFNEIKNLDGLFLCGTSPKVLPISKVDNIELPSDNKVLQDIRVQYNTLVQEYINSHK
jgi:branched-chain amino acid aminotransferase